MESHIKIDSAMTMLTRATSITHVFDEGAVELGCGTIQYALEFDGQLYLACKDDDSEQVVVVPVERWDLCNLLESIDDTLSVLSFR